ncbi:hypothetical protein WR25_17512 [Diploscapter pachys]|uniref:Acyltransferase n=1 Tax=Diploscapter pachys TaxID=2018661 RepID=A0A2A2L674_9BILA|nr:hypothetical protein WR25_17512 [Diploscapter pachys]
MPSLSICFSGMLSLSEQLLSPLKGLLCAVSDPASWPRRLQTLAVMHFVFFWVLMLIISTWLPSYIFFFTPLWWTMPLYLVWYFYSFKDPARGSRPWSWYKNHKVWKYFADYFPMKLVKTADLPPNKNYIICCHPHGIMSIGSTIHLLTNGTGFSEKFPGLTSTIMTLNGQFYFPFRREVGMWLGGVNSSAESLQYLLKNPGKGRAVGIVIGGATEALDAHPGNFDLNLLSRRGFCKYALKHGADLVPMYSFGENDLYDQVDNPRGSHFRNFQQTVKSLFNFCPPLLKGRSVFNWNFGLLPYRKPVNSVVGKPIHVDRVADPSPDQIDALHSAYCEALVDLFEEHKSHYGIPPHVHLNLY